MPQDPMPGVHGARPPTPVTQAGDEEPTLALTGLGVQARQPAWFDEDTGELPIPVTAVPASPEELNPPEPRPADGLHPPHIRRRLAVAVGAAVLLLGGLAVAAVAGGAAEQSTAKPAPGTPSARWESSAAPGVVTQPRDGRTEAGLDLVDAATEVTVRSAAIGDDLYRVSAPGGGARPHTTDENGRIRLALDGGRAVDIVLNDRVRWDLRVAGGAELHRIDLTGSTLRSVELAGGSGRIELALPRPDGTLTVRMAGGVREFDVRTAGGAVPVRVRIGSGAGRVVVGGRSHDGVAAGASFTPESWDRAAGRIDLDAAAGLSALTVDEG